MDKIAKILLVFLCALLLVCAVPAMAAKETSGKCGENVTWRFDETTHTLTISGTGEMNNAPYGKEMRWAPLYDQIHHVVIEEGITSICEFAFAYNTKIETVTIPQSVTSICNYAFANSPKLEKIVIPEGVTKIGNYAFYSSALETAVFHDEITYIGIDAFANTFLESVTIPAGITELADGVFRGCLRLKNVTFHDKLERIGSYAFEGCESLTQIELPDSVETESYAFENCTSLKYVHLGKGERYLGATFRGCKALEEIVIPDNIISVGDDAFSGCSALKSVYLGAGVEKVGKLAFEGCKNLQQFTLSPDNTTFTVDNGVLYSENGTVLYLFPNGFAGDYHIPEGTLRIDARAAYQCHSITGLYFPGTVTEVGKEAFLFCKAVKTLSLSDGLTTIYNEAFRGLESLESLAIPQTVTLIENNAFGSCDAIKSLSFLGSRPTIRSYAFSSIRGDAYYPAGDATWENHFPADAYHLNWHPGCAGAHTLLHEAGTEPSCTAAGQQASAYCTACGFVAAYPTRIPAIPHSFGPWQHASAPGTPYRDWKVTRGCVNCSFTETRLAAQLDPSQLPEGIPEPSDPGTVPTTPQSTAPATTPNTDKVVEPAKLGGVSIVILVIVVVALCFVGVEVYLLHKKKNP